jgi:hypothetical protein
MGLIGYGCLVAATITYYAVEAIVVLSAGDIDQAITTLITAIRDQDQ